MEARNVDEERMEQRRRRTRHARALDAIQDLTMSEHGEFVAALTQADRDLAERLHKKLGEALA